MTTALIPIADMERMAIAIAKSNLFGMKTQEQVLALMLIAQAEGRHPAIVARDYDIIQNRPAKKAEAMLRDFLDAGGKVEWHQLDDTCADATFSHPQGGSARISWDMARAKKAGISGKDNYQKYTRQMLRSRTVSEGCRTVYPAATSGLYEPGEVRTIAREDAREVKDMGSAQVVGTDPLTAEQETALRQAEGAPKPAAQESAAAPGSPSLPEGAVPAAPGAAGQLHPDLVTLLGDKVAEAHWNKAKLLDRYGVTGFAFLTPAQADEIVIAADARIAELAKIKAGA